MCHVSGIPIANSLVYNILFESKDMKIYSDSYSLYDAETSSIIASYEIHRILYCEPGQAGSKQEACFAFTWSHGDTPEFRVYQCHIFRCNIPEAVHQVNCK